MTLIEAAFEAPQYRIEPARRTTGAAQPDTGLCDASSAQPDGTALRRRLLMTVGGSRYSMGTWSWQDAPSHPGGPSPSQTAGLPWASVSFRMLIHAGAQKSYGHVAKGASPATPLRPPASASRQPSARARCRYWPPSTRRTRCSSTSNPGQAAGPPAALLPGPVWEAIARALQLDDTERGHLFDLAQPTASRARRPRRLAPQRVRPAVYRTLDSLGVPAVVQGRCMDVLAANKLGYALIADFQSRPHRERNATRFVFLDDAALSLYTDWEQVAGDCVAALRLYAGRHSDDPQLTELIGELSLRSDTFRRLWADHDVLAHTTGTKRLHHPLVGDLTLDYVVLAVEEDPDQTLIIYTPEPASPSAEAIGILASWTGTATGPHASPAESHDPAG